MSSVSSIPSNSPIETTQPTASGSVGEVFRVFLQLGLRSFGGPVAHLGYFREELVVRRKWIDEAGIVTSTVFTAHYLANGWTRIR
jgi:hypothetical protein